jgi:hypothetical protein
MGMLVGFAPPVKSGRPAVSVGRGAVSKPGSPLPAPIILYIKRYAPSHDPAASGNTRGGAR